MDPISDFIIALKNASMVGKPSVLSPYSKMKHEIARVLKDAGYIASYEKKSRETGAVLEVMLPSVVRIHDIKRVSKPSRRMYMGVRDIKPFKRGFGLLVLSTPKGILSGDVARKEQVGGEILFEVW